MPTTLEHRVRQLEAGSGGECPRCSGVVVVILNGEFSSASKHGAPWTEGRYREFEAEEEDGRCPVCGAGREEITVGWSFEA